MGRQRHLGSVRMLVGGGILRCTEGFLNSHQSMLQCGMKVHLPPGRCPPNFVLHLVARNSISANLRACGRASQAYENPNMGYREWSPRHGTFGNAAMN